ncbi:MAG: hypothetical protein PHX18_08235 [Candidatus Gastranaerophilales bacterium]|nr:hypothetical protein [Candidatus Gastranaerophilales bacterium]
MAEKKFYAKIYIKTVANPVIVEVFAENSLIAKKIIEARSEFKSFYIMPQARDFFS